MRRLLLVPLLVLSGCGPLLFAEIEEPELCVGVKAIVFSGLAAGSASAGELRYDLGEEIPELDDPDPNTEFEIRLSEVRVTPAPGTDLSGIEGAVVYALPPAGSTVDPVELVSWRRSPGSAPPTVIVARSHAEFDLLDYLAQGEIALRAEYAGAMPEQDWTGDVEACFYIRAFVDYGAILTGG